jgi:hypothetical protein
MRFSIYGDSCRSDRTLDLDTRWGAGAIVRLECKSASVCLAVARHDVRLVQSQGAAGGRGNTARSEEPSEVMQTHRSCRDFLPDAEADIARIRWQPCIFKLCLIAVPLIERLVECTAVLRCKRRATDPRWSQDRGRSPLADRFLPALASGAESDSSTPCPSGHRQHLRRLH